MENICCNNYRLSECQRSNETCQLSVLLSGLSIINILFSIYSPNMHLDHYICTNISCLTWWQYSCWQKVLIIFAAALVDFNTIIPYNFKYYTFVLQSCDKLGLLTWNGYSVLLKFVTIEHVLNFKTHLLKAKCISFLKWKD